MAGKTKLKILALLCAPLALASAPSRANSPAMPDHPILSAPAKGDVDAVEPSLPQPDFKYLPAQIKGAKVFNHAATEMIDRGEGFLPGIATVEKIFKAARGSETKSDYAQFLGMFYTYVGAYDLAASVYPEFHSKKLEDRLNRQPDLELRPALDGETCEGPACSAHQRESWQCGDAGFTLRTAWSATCAGIHLFRYGSLPIREE